MAAAFAERATGRHGHLATSHTRESGWEQSARRGLLSARLAGDLGRYRKKILLLSRPEPPITVGASGRSERLFTVGGSRYGGEPGVRIDSTSGGCHPGIALALASSRAGWAKAMM